MFSVWLAAAACASTATGSAEPLHNTGEACRDFHLAYERHMHGDSPERLAFEQAVAAQYNGSGEPTAVSAAKAAYFRAVARDVRAIAGRATDPDLRAALTGAADWADATANGQATTAAELTNRWQPVLNLCPKQSPGPPTR